MALSKIEQEGNFKGVIRGVYPPNENSKLPKLSIHVEATHMQVKGQGYQEIAPGAGAYVDLILTTPEGDTNEEGIEHFAKITGWNGEWTDEAFAAIEGVSVEFYIKQKGGYYNARFSGVGRKPQDFSALASQYQSLTKSIAKKVAPAVTAAPAASPAPAPATVTAPAGITAPALPDTPEDTVPF